LSERKWTSFFFHFFPFFFLSSFLLINSGFYLYFYTHFILQKILHHKARTKNKTKK